MIASDLLRGCTDTIILSYLSQGDSYGYEINKEILQNLIDRYHDLLADGKSEEAAYNGAVEGIGDVNELLETLNLQNTAEQPCGQNSANNGNAAAENIQGMGQSEQTAARQRNAVLTAISVMLYILSPVPCIIFEDEIIGPVLLFVMIAAATGIIIFKSMTRSPSAANQTAANVMSDEIYEQNSRKKSLKRCLSSVLWVMITVAYFVVSFTTFGIRLGR